MSVYAANLYDVYKNRGPEEYRDADTFFRKTHMTANLERILDDIRQNLHDNIGESFLHVETPFGGGKTHSLIAMYHKAKEWKAKVVVLVGTDMDASDENDTMWGMIEQQLDGTRTTLKGSIAPSRKRIRQVLERQSQPVLILIDELLEYMVKADGINTGKNTLADQTIAFIQELVEAAATTPSVCIVASFPASHLEMADDERANEILGKINHVAGRVERKITPMEPRDIPSIIRARLFVSSDSEIRAGAEHVITEYVDRAESEDILPRGITVSQYRELFRRSFPFTPNTIDTLYERWGSYPSFQRTRGVLRLLAMVVHTMKTSERPYITLANFDLNNDTIRRELIKHIGNEYDSVMSKDITGEGSGASKIDAEMKGSVAGLCLGTKAAICTFMMSFSGGEVGGATPNQIKMELMSLGLVSSSVVDTVLNMFRTNMFHSMEREGRYLFTNQQNLNRLKHNRMDSINDDTLRDHEYSMLRDRIAKSAAKLSVILWPRSPKDVPETRSVSLCIMDTDDTKQCRAITAKAGSSPRIYRNAILYLCPDKSTQPTLRSILRGMLALESIAGDKHVKLQKEQHKELYRELNAAKERANTVLRQCYRNVYVPVGNDDKFESIPLTMWASGDARPLNATVYDMLRGKEIHETLGPARLKHDYLTRHEFAKTAILYETMLSSPGSLRPISQDVIKRGIIQGVAEKMFGIGHLVEKDIIHDRYDDTSGIKVTFSENEIIIRDLPPATDPDQGESSGDMKPHSDDTTPTDGGHEKDESTTGDARHDSKNDIDAQIRLSRGRVSEIINVLISLNSKVDTIDITIRTNGGSVSDADVDTIQEACQQMDPKSRVTVRD